MRKARKMEAYRGHSALTDWANKPIGSWESFWSGLLHEGRWKWWRWNNENMNFIYWNCLLFAGCRSCVLNCYDLFYIYFLRWLLGAHNDFFCKITVQRSIYYLEISNSQERLKISGWPIYSSRIIEIFVLNLRFSDVMMFTFYYQNTVE